MSDERNIDLLTDEEELAIAELRRVAKKWPDSITLFSAAGQLDVVRRMPDGSVYFLESIHGIPNDGGDPDWHTPPPTAEGGVS